jgi:hypothetical protein
MRNNDSLLSCLQKKHGENNSAIAVDADKAYRNFMKFTNNSLRGTDPFNFMMCPNGYQSFLMPIDTIVLLGSRIGIVVEYRLHSDGWSMYVKCSDGSYDVRYEDAAIAPLPDGLVDLIRRTGNDNNK